MRPAVLALFVALILPFRLLQAQRLAPSQFPTLDSIPAGRGVSAAAVAVRPNRDPVLLALGGVLGGAAGLLGGALVGARLTEHDCEDCGFVGLIYGGVIGASSGIPLGVHATNGGRGRLLPSLLSSLAIGGVGFGLAAMADRSEIIVALPVAQLITAIAIERSTSRTGPGAPAAPAN